MEERRNRYLASELEKFVTSGVGANASGSGLGSEGNEGHKEEADRINHDEERNRRDDTTQAAERSA